MYALKSRKDLRRASYDLAALHGLATETIAERKQKEFDLKMQKLREDIANLKTSLEKKCANKLEKITLQQRIPELEKKEKLLKEMETKKPDFLTEYLLEALPILNEFHMLNSKLCSEEDDLKKKKLEFEVSKLSDSFVDKFFPEMRRRRFHDENYVESFLDLNKSSCCGRQLVQTQNSAMVCPSCGIIQEQNAVNVSNPLKNLSYSRNISSSQGFSYRRVNHLREWLRQMQGRTASSLPKEILEMVRTETKKSTRPRSSIDGEYVRKLLKRLKLHTYYEQSVSIAKILNPDLKILKLEPAYEEKLIGQFCALEQPYEKIREKIDPKRKNFLSYPFTFYRLNELNKRPELNKGIRLLKSQKLINRQDKFFKALMEKVNWKYLGHTIAF